jgi:hypothetical protein
MCVYKSIKSINLFHKVTAERPAAYLTSLTTGLSPSCDIIIGRDFLKEVVKSRERGSERVEKEVVKSRGRC